jgi:hypothetical protein
VGVVANDLQRSAPLFAITLPAAAVIFLVCGVALGRLSMHLQLRLDPTVRATERRREHSYCRAWSLQAKRSEAKRSKAIQKPAKRLDCLVAIVPRNDERARCREAKTWIAGSSPAMTK